MSFEQSEPLAHIAIRTKYSSMIGSFLLTVAPLTQGKSAKVFIFKINITDELARAGTDLVVSSIIQAIDIPSATIHLDVINSFNKKAQSR